MDRREFLHPRHLAATAGQLIGAAQELASLDTAPPDEIALVRLSWRAMATGFEIVLPFGTSDHVSIGRGAFELLDRLEDQMTVYRDSSEISRLNHTAHRRPVRVEGRLFALLQRAVGLWRETERCYDITAHALISAWGFFRGPRRIPSPQELAQALAATGSHQVTIDDQARTLRFHHPDLGINLGSIGKGYALDRMNELIARRWKVPAILLQGGTSSVYAGGDPHGDGRGWLVRIRHPWEDRPLASVWLRNQALGTSAATFQHLEHQGKKFGHILDPRTGWPAEGLASVSVMAPTAAEADALSTAFYVGGVDLAKRYCETHPGIGAILLREDDSRPVVVGLRPGEYTISQSVSSSVSQPANHQPESSHEPD